MRNLLDDRDLKFMAVVKRMRHLFLELSQIMEPLDPRWLAFGFKISGAKQTPEVPQNVTVVLVEGSAAALKWDKTPRAEYYRVRVKLVGTDEEARVVGTPSDPDFTFEQLPSESLWEVSISAVNSGGESQPSAVVQVTPRGVAQVFNLLYRGFSIRMP